MKDFGTALNDELKALDKRVVTFDIVVELLEKHKLFGFVTGIARLSFSLEMPEYEEAVNEIIKSTEADKKLKEKRKSTKDEEEKGEKKKSRSKTPKKRTSTPKRSSSKDKK